MLRISPCRIGTSRKGVRAASGSLDFHSERTRRRKLMIVRYSRDGTWPHAYYEYTLVIPAILRRCDAALRIVPRRGHHGGHESQWNGPPAARRRGRTADVPPRALGA